MPPPPRALPDELLEEILLRLPPEDPGCLFRASLVCKPWRSRLTGAAFPRRYREFHGTPPLLGFFENDKKFSCWFSPLSSTSPVPPVHPGHRDLFALDSRHGLVLLRGSCERDYIVWDPVRHRQWEFPARFRDPFNGAAVLCAVDGCDHLDCHGDPFLVVCVDTDFAGVAHACVYSSEARAWGPVTSCDEHPSFPVADVSSFPKPLVGNSLYFLSNLGTVILRYNLFSQKLSTITWPAMYEWEDGNHILMRMEDDVLGCASLQESRLEVWAMEFDRDGAVKWVLRTVVELENWLPYSFSSVSNFADGVGVLFVQTDTGIFTVELKSGRVKKISSGTDEVIPYIRFYTPDQSGGITPPSTIVSLENVSTAQDKDHDLLLPHLSGKLDDAKKKWVEKGEEDCEWEKDGWEEDGCDEQEEDDLVRKRKKAALDLFENGSEAIEEGKFIHAQICFRDALDYMLRVLHYGRLSTMCISTYYKYGLALLYEAQSKNAPSQDLVKGTTRRVDTGSSKASGGNMRQGDTGKDLDLAWKMLQIARAILEKSSCIPMEKVEIFCALAEVSMEREDIDYSLRAFFKALGILEHLVEPDHCQIILLNFHIFLAFNSASKIGDAIPYGAKVISLYKSRMQKLKNAKEACLADKGENASAAEVGSEKSLLDKEIEFLTSVFTVLEKKLEDLAQSMLTPVSKASGAHNVGYAAPGAASLACQIAGPSNSMSTATTIETHNLGTARHLSNTLMPSKSLLNLAARNLKRVLHM